MYRKLFGFIGLLVAAHTVYAAALGSAFTYQGELNVSSQAATGLYDFEIALYTTPTAGTALDTAVRGDVSVNQGLFAVTLDYTDVPFASGTQYYLELRVRLGASTGAYTTLLPRQAIFATPYALHAQTVDPSAIVGAASARPVHAYRGISLPGTGSPVAGDSSITIGVDGLPIATIYDAANGDLLAVHCDDPACAQRTITTLDSNGIVGRGNSIIVPDNGLPAISYVDSTNGDIKMARCLDVRCTTANLSVVDAAVGDSRRSVILNGTGSTVGTVTILYHDDLQGDLESANCTPTGVCTLATLDSTNNVGHKLDAVRIGTRGYVAYGDETNGSLRLKSCNLPFSNCAASASLPVDAAGVPLDVALVVPPDARLVILYVRGTQLRSARCDALSCASITAGTLLDSNAGAVSATLGSDGLPVMIVINNLFATSSFFKCLDYACAAALYVGGLGASGGQLDARPAITLGTHGSPIAIHRFLNFAYVLICDTPECGAARRR